ncbi:MAG: carboxypeptidase regulatory-like domain-containing protein [Candidatus Thiodiazotropha sp. (ex Dulcina madagascariensis)]|nr:carboxypeptidase regulatory-like domain-containing protein [Candidatus Thiodiazotropha sp. (ex Dulcina madagascariensis)]
MLFWHGPILGVTLSGFVLEGATALSGVEIMLVNAHDGVIVNRDYTNKTGSFRFSVKPGVYDIGAFKHEYATGWNRGVSVKEANVSIQIELEPEAFSEEPLSTSGDCE